MIKGSSHVEQDHPVFYSTAIKGINLDVYLQRKEVNVSSTRF